MLGLVWETLAGLVVGVVLSLAMVVKRASFPEIVEVQLTDGGAFVAIDAGAATQPLDGVAIVRFGGPLIYANADDLVLACSTLASRHRGANRLILDAEVMSALDASGAAALEAIDDAMLDLGIEFHIAVAHQEVRAQIRRSHLHERFIGRVHISIWAATGRMDGRGHAQ